MKIIYTINPLDYKVVLNDEDSAILKDKVLIEELKETLYSIEEGLLKKDIDQKHLLNILSLDDIYVRVDGLVEYYKNELQESHAGNCTSFPSNCVKCYAEELLNIKSPIFELNKYQMYLLFNLKRENPAIKSVSNIIELCYIKLLTNISNEEKEETIKLIKFLENWKIKVND